MTKHPLEMEFSGKSFLIIDDFQGMRSMLRDILRGCGANLKNIQMAAAGNEAIDALSKEKFDVVLCDFNLGAGKNGQQILEEAKFRGLIGPACAWVMITAEKTTDVVTGAAEYQPDSYLIKPITEATLRMRLAKLWEKKKAFAEIDAALAHHEQAKAIRLCDERLAVDKANAAELQRLKCQLLLASGEFDQARQAYESVLAVRDTPWAKLGIAKIHYQAGDFIRAKALLAEIIEDNSAFLEAYDWQAKTLQALGELEAAGKVLERATRLSPNSVLRQKFLGDIALKTGDLDNAERAFRKSVALGEHSVLKTPSAYLGLAKTCSAKDSPEEALRVLGSLNKTFDNDEVRLKALAVEGQVHHKSGNLEQANKTAQELGKLMTAGYDRTDSETTMEVAGLLFATGDRDNAITLLQKEVKNSPDNAEILAEIREVFTAANMEEEGAKLVETSRQEAIDMMDKGALLAREGKLEEAVLWMRNASQAMPGKIRVLFNFAHVLVSQMQKTGPEAELIAEARASLMSANQLAPGDKRFGLMTSALDKLEPGSTD